MAAAVTFARECPTCGRMLSISVRLIGQKIACSHCQATFIATHSSEKAEPTPLILDRVDAMLRLSRTH
jgi:ribosomal protein S27AE